MLEDIISLAGRYDRIISPGLFILFLLLTVQNYISLRSQKNNNLNTIQKRSLITLIFLTVSWFVAVLTNEVFFRVAYHFSGASWNDGRNTYIFLYVVYVIISLLVTTTVTSQLLSSFHYTGSRSGRYINFLASAFIPTLGGLLIGFLTSFLHLAWWSRTNHMAVGSFIYSLPSIFTLFIQVLILDKHFKKMKKIRLKDT